jgi:hypothetical protein
MWRAGNKPVVRKTLLMASQAACQILPTGRDILVQLALADPTESAWKQDLATPL